MSDLIDTEMATKLAALSLTSLEDRTWSVYNQRESEFFFFIPNTDDISTTTETSVYVFAYRPSIGVAGWCKFVGWNFTCGARSLQGNIVFGDANGELWLYGSKDNPIYTDYSLGDADEGIPISFDWERPWTDLGKRRMKKKCKYIALDTRGTGQFTVRMYVDRIKTTQTGIDSPVLSMALIGGDAGGFGDAEILYGSGRNTALEQHIAWPADFMIGKLRFSGQVTGPLTFISISLFYQNGGMNR